MRLRVENVALPALHYCRILPRAVGTLPVAGRGRDGGGCVVAVGASVITHQIDDHQSNGSRARRPPSMRFLFSGRG